MLTLLYLDAFKRNIGFIFDSLIFYYLQIQEEVDQLESKLNALQKNQVVISQQEKERIEQGREKMIKEWKKRRRIAKDILDAILENYPKSKSELYEDIGIETDEDAGVSIPKI